MKQHLLVGNPTAQSGKNAERIERALQFMADAGAQCTFLATLPAGATIRAVQQALDAGSYEVVIAMGGDGTFREVASALVTCRRKADVAMGMLPTGTANDQGRSFGLSADEDALFENVNVILQGVETQLDAGELTTFDEQNSKLFNGYFFDSAAWGISARILAQRNIDREFISKVPIVRDLVRDQTLYAASALKTFLASYVVSDKFEVDALVDGKAESFQGLSDFLLKGTRVYAGAWVVDRHSKHDDGFFEAVPFRGKRDWTSKAIVDLDGNPLTEERLNALGVAHSKPFRFQSLELNFRAKQRGEPVLAQADGEEIPAGVRASVRVLPRALRLVVPPDFASGG